MNVVACMYVQVWTVNGGAGLKIATGRGDRVGTWTRDSGGRLHSHATVANDVEKSE
jgi:hypothetical protein